MWQVSRKHPLNPDGRFWVNQDTFCDCKACLDEAPDNIRFDETVGMSYVFKQPDTDKELQMVREAVRCCPVEAVVEIDV